MAKVINLISKSFGRRLRAARTTKGYDTAREFAAQLGVEENTLTRWERGETEPSFETLLRICHMIDVTPDQLLLGPKAAGIFSKSRTTMK